MDNKIAIISDVHGNRWALEKVLEDIEQHEIYTIFDLGDSLYGPLAPLETGELFLNHEIISVCGNEDEILYNPKKIHENPTLEYVSDQITPKLMEGVKSLPLIRRMDEFLCFH